MHESIYNSVNGVKYTPVFELSNRLGSHGNTTFHGVYYQATKSICLRIPDIALMYYILAISHSTHYIFSALWSTLFFLLFFLFLILQVCSMNHTIPIRLDNNNHTSI